MFKATIATLMLCLMVLGATACHRSASNTETAPAQNAATPKAPASSTPPSAAVQVVGNPLDVASMQTCSTDSDCVVKDVGNCCGYFPACVNVNAKPDPAAVQADCAKRDLSSICGFQEIASCACVEGQCRAAGNGGEVVL